MRNADILTKQTKKIADISNLVFGQHRIGSQEFFLKRGSISTIPLSSLPHYTYLEEGAEPKLGCEYDEYLKASWKSLRQATETARLARMVEYSKLFQSFLPEDSTVLTPISVCRRPDGKEIIVHGNHRAAIAAFLGKDLPIEHIEQLDYLVKVARSAGEYYGPDLGVQPYQSLFYDGNNVLAGRRLDMLERFNLIDKEDVIGKTVLDLGCNIGSNCFLASMAGASRVVGIDNNRDLVSSALRLNAFFGTDSLFYVRDLNDGVLADVSPADTVFCFSVSAYIEDRNVLKQALLALTGNVLYFEGHPGTKAKDYDHILRGGFSAEMIGMLPCSAKDPVRNRPLLRCERA